MIQLFLIISFILGLILGWKICEYVLTNGIALLSTRENSGVIIDEETNKIIIDCNILKNSKLNKKNIN